MVKPFCVRSCSNWMAETATLVLPLRDIDEVSRWAMQRLGNPHRKSHTGGKLRIAQAGELVRRGVT